MGASHSRKFKAVFLLLIASFLMATVQGAEPAVQTGRYVFCPDRSTLVQTGGFAGVLWTYTIEGQFCLIVDSETSSARFEQVDASAIDDSEPPRTLDPNDAFNLTGLTGTVVDETTIEFAGQAANETDVRLRLTFENDTVHLTGETTPPPNSADFFLFSLDAVATRKYAGGTGNPKTPYRIATADQMNAIGTDPNDWDKHFQLIADIDLTAFDGQEGRPAFNIIAASIDSGESDCQSIPFTGVFDGNGHAISNFVCTLRKMLDVGLFGVVAGPNAEIRNLRLLAPKIDVWAYNVGALVGHLKQGTLLNCHAEDVNVDGHSGNVGGLVGQGGLAELLPRHTLAVIRNCSSTGRISANFSGTAGGLVGRDLISLVLDCYSACEVDSGYTAGGLIGFTEFSKIANCYTRGNITGGTFAGGLLGYSRGGALANCYSATRLSGTGRIGGFIGFDQGTGVRASFWDAEIGDRMDQAGSTGKTTRQMQDANTFAAAGWDFVGQADGPSDIWAQLADEGYPILWWQLPEPPELPFSAGNGTADNPYVIDTASQLNDIGHNPRLMTAHFRLDDNVDLSGIHFHLIGCDAYPYTGVFDGGGFTISHFSYTATEEEDIGLFRVIHSRDAEVRNLTLVNPNIEAAHTNNVASLVGTLEEGVLRDCHVVGGWLSGNYTTGGLVGQSGRYELEESAIPTRVLGCSATAHVTGQMTVGGLIGMTGEGGLIVDCHANGDVTGVSQVGGLTGSAYSVTIRNCSSAGRVVGGRMAGGLTGVHVSGALEGSFSTALVKGTMEIGGLAGVNAGAINNCYSKGSVEGENTVGGLVGQNGSVHSTGESPGIISKSYGTGSISGDENIGGLAGCQLVGSITDSFWDITTSGLPARAGGPSQKTAQMQTASTFLEAGWDFVGEAENGIDDIWWIVEGQDYPRLWWEATEEF